MDILAFLRSLPHKFSKSEIAKTCELTLQSLRDNTLPAYESAATLFRAFKPASSEARGYASTLRRLAGGGNDMVGTIEEALKNGEKLLKGIIEKADTLFADQEATLAVNYQKATYLQLVSSIDFANDYARKFLDYLYVIETQHADPSQQLKDNLSPGQVAYIDQYFVAFCTTIKIMLLDFGALDKQVNGLPDVVVTELSEQTLPQTLGASKVDPLGMRNLVLPVSVGVKWNPFYLIGTAVAAFQVACFKAATEEHELLQLRMLNLKKLHEKHPDPKLQQQIEYISERVAKLNYEIMTKQEAWGV